MIRRQARKVKKPTKRKCCSALNVLKVVAIYILVIGIVFGGLYGYGTIMELWKDQTEGENIVTMKGQNIVTMKEYSQRQVDEQQILQESNRIARRKNKQAYVEINDPIICSEHIKKDLQNSNKKRIFWTQDAVHAKALEEDQKKNEDETNAFIDNLEMLLQKEPNEDINIDIKEILENYEKNIKNKDETNTFIDDLKKLVQQEPNQDINVDIKEILENHEKNIAFLFKNGDETNACIDDLAKLLRQKPNEDTFLDNNIDIEKILENHEQNIIYEYRTITKINDFQKLLKKEKKDITINIDKILDDHPELFNFSSLKKGLDEIAKMWNEKFETTDKMLSEIKEQIKDFEKEQKEKLKEDLETIEKMWKEDFEPTDEQLSELKEQVRNREKKLEVEQKERLKEELEKIAKMWKEKFETTGEIFLEIKNQVEEEKKLEVEQKEKLKEGLDTIKNKWNKDSEKGKQRDEKLRQMNETIKARKEKEEQLKEENTLLTLEAEKQKNKAEAEVKNSDYYEPATNIGAEKQFFSHGGKGKQSITHCMELCLHMPTCWGFYYEYKDQYCIFSEVIEIQNGDTEDKIPDYVPITSLYRRKASLLDVKMKNDDEIALLSDFKIVINTNEKQKITSDKILAENADFTTKIEHVNSFLSKDEPKYAEENMEAFISKIVTCTAEDNKTEINCLQNAVPIVIDFVAPDGMDIKFELNKTTHYISTKTSSQFWSALPFESNYEVNIVEDPAVYECSTENEKNGTLENKETVKIDFICAKITKTCEKSTGNSGKGLVHMDFIYLFLIAVGIVTILFICGGFAYLHLNYRKNESDDNNSILVQKVSDVEEQHQDAQANLQITKQKLIKTKKGLKKTVKKLKATKKDLKEARKLSLENENFDDEFAFGQNKKKRKKEIGWNTYFFK